MSAATFDAEWLRLRAPFDAAAGDRPGPAALARAFGTVLRRRRERGALRLLDLGGGVGANVCRLAPRIPGSQSWTIVDNDDALLARLDATIAAWARRIGGRLVAIEGGVSVTTPQRIVTVVRCTHDLRDGLADLPLAAADGVVASALLDLVSADWLERAAAALAAHRLPCLFTLNVDRALRWRPAAADDAAIAAAFRRDLGRDKGFGHALGADAGTAAATILGARGYTVETAGSHWQIGAADAAVHRAMLSFVVPAALRHEPDAAEARSWRRRVGVWQAAKVERIAAASLELTVGHTDVLAAM